jgi:diguanylate cyclase (GGDEF)-like protein
MRTSFITTFRRLKVAGLEWLAGAFGIGGGLGVATVRSGSAGTATITAVPPGAAARARVVRPQSPGSSRPAEPDVRPSVAITAMLRDIRDLMRAEETVFWRWDREKSSLRPDSWSSDSPRPLHFRMGEWGPLVQWSAEELIAHVGGEGENPSVVCAPVIVGETLAGVLSTASAGELRLTRGAAMEWQRRHAAQLATLLELQELQRSHQAADRRSRLLLDAASMIQSRGEPEELMRSICESALALSGGEVAVLARWDPALERAGVQHALPEGNLAAGAVVPPDSLIAQSCEAAMPIFVDDARQVALRSIAGGPLGVTDLGSLAIIPLVRDGITIGALMVGSEEVGRVGAEEGRSLSILGSMAISALEVAWRVEEAEGRARIDSLTGLPNRLAFEEQLNRILNETDRFGGACSLLLIDLDGFKQVNDSLGHPAGDAVLRHVAGVLREGIRNVDAPARVGGEELAVILPQTGLVGAMELAERLRARFEADRPVLLTGEVKVTVSIGVATYPEAVRERGAIYEAADRALYLAKSDGRNCVRSTPTKAFGRIG